VHDLLLHHGLLLLKLSELALQMLVLVFLHTHLLLKLFVVAHNEGVDYLDVLVIKGLKVVVEHSDVLSQALYLFSVFPQN